MSAISRELFQSFCGTEESRPYLMKPYSRGAHSYATCGRICIRVPRAEEYGEIEHANPEPLFADYFKEVPRGKLVLPDMPEPHLIECVRCDGSGKSHDCPSCACKCSRCNGTGKEEIWPSTIGIGEAVYSGAFIKKITKLPGLLFPIAPPKTAAVGFVFDGGDGLLMPMVQTAPEAIATVEAPGT